MTVQLDDRHVLEEVFADRSAPAFHGLAVLAGLAPFLRFFVCGAVWRRQLLVAEFDKGHPSGALCRTGVLVSIPR